MRIGMNTCSSSTIGKQRVFDKWTQYPASSSQRDRRMARSSARMRCSSVRMHVGGRMPPLTAAWMRLPHAAVVAAAGPNRAQPGYRAEPGASSSRHSYKAWEVPHRAQLAAGRRRTGSRRYHAHNLGGGWLPVGTGTVGEIHTHTPKAAGSPTALREVGGPAAGGRSGTLAPGVGRSQPVRGGDRPTPGGGKDATTPGNAQSTHKRQLRTPLFP